MEEEFDDRYYGYKIIQYDEVTDEDRKLQEFYDFIEASAEFLSLAGKTQVLNIGVSDRKLRITTRQIHDMHVSQNAMKIAKEFKKRDKKVESKDVLLAQITGLAHDLGHTPFGHDGEEFLSDELQKFDSDLRFSHSEYGAEIVQVLAKKFNEMQKRLSQTEYGKEDSSAEIGQKDVDQIAKGVRNHGQYYGYRVKDETPAQQCVRLADTLSFMISDLSDLMRGSSNGERILVEKRVNEQYAGFRGVRSALNQEQENSSDKEDKISKEAKAVIDALIEGGGALLQLHEDLIKEAFSPEREGSFLYGKRGQIHVTILDDYKILQELSEGLEQNHSLEDDMQASLKDLSNIATYFEYLSQNKITAVENHEFISIISNKFEKGTTEDQIIKKLNGIIEKSREKEVKLDDDEKELVSSILDDKDLHRNISAQMEKIRQTEFALCPKLMTLFSIQDLVQYKEIIYGNKEKLGNDTIEVRDENGIKKEANVKDVISDKFEKIVKLAYYAEKHPKETKDDALDKYNGQDVPNFGNLGYKPLKYAIYAFQQMQNKDFTDDTIFQKIAQDLNIEESKIQEIFTIDMKDIYHDYEVQKIQSLSKENEYEPEDILKMTTQDIDFNTSSVKELYNYISNRVKDTEINKYNKNKKDNMDDVNR